MTSARAFSCASVGGGEGGFALSIFSPYFLFFFCATVFRLLAIRNPPTVWVTQYVPRFRLRIPGGGIGSTTR